MGWLRRHFKFIILIILVAFVFGAITGSKIKLPDLNEIIPPVNIEEVRTMVAPAVDSTGKGVPSTLRVTVRPGTGLVLVNINNVLAGFDTQESAKIAAQEAGKFTDISLDKVDIIYSIEADAPLVSGSSAGAAMAVSTIAALQKRDLNPQVSITGAIDEEGKITPVAGIQPKAEAVKSAGVSIFLVPFGQGLEKKYQRTIVCEDVNDKEICRTQYISKSVSLSEDLGIRLIEVSTIKEAIDYFIL